MKVREAHGWKIYFWTLFDEHWRAIRLAVAAKKNALNRGEITQKEYLGDKTVSLFAALVEIVHNVVPLDPSKAEFRQGNTLGSENKDWFRVKNHGLPSRWRLFFRYSTTDKVIVFVWLNDEGTMRKAGDSKDVYAVFKGMLKSGAPPSDFDELMKSVTAGKG